MHILEKWTQEKRNEILGVMLIEFEDLGTDQGHYLFRLWI